MKKYGIVVGGRHVLAATLVLVAVACGGSGPGSADATPALEDGFQRYTALGETCRASVATAPANSYGSLAFVPCAWGEAYCNELKWDGAVTWDPTGSGDLLKFSLQAALDSTGAVRRLLITHQYPRTSTAGVPSEAVAYDARTGAPVAAWRNAGDPLGSGGPSCAINVAVGTDEALILATPSGGTDVRMARESLVKGGTAHEFEKIDAESSVMHRAPIASSNTAAFDDDSGRIWRVDLASGEVANDVGPSRRVWPVLVTGDDVLVRTATPTTDGYYSRKAVGSYDHVAVLAPMLVADATQLAWATIANDKLEVRTVPRSAPAPTDAAKVVATVDVLSPHADILMTPSIVGMSLGDGVLAIQTEVAIERTSMLYVVDLAKGSVRQRAVQGGASAMKLLANTEKQVWFGRSAYLTGGETQFDALVSLDMSRTCEGTLTCSGLGQDACSAAPGCNVQIGCSGNPTDPCAYTNETDCFAHACAWDSGSHTCSPRGSCDLTPEDACRNTTGCVYDACVPTVSACSELGPDRCEAQPGCSFAN
jgi:hypothetical protein